MGEQNILRGEKWTKVRAEAVFQNRTKDVQWIDSQKSITDDIAEYEDSIKPKDKPKDKVKKAPDEA